MAVELSTNTEARLFSRYLIGREANKQVLGLYRDALQETGHMDRLDQALLRFALKHPLSIGYLDAGLIFYKPHSELRHRLYLMLAILEAQAEYSALFLPKRRTFLYIAFLVWCGIRSVFKAAVGSILVRSIRP